MLRRCFLHAANALLLTRLAVCSLDVGPPDNPDDACLHAELNALDDDAVNLLQKNAIVYRSTHRADSTRAPATSLLSMVTSTWSEKAIMHDFYHHLTHVVSAGPVCSQFESDSTNFVVSLTIPTLMVVLFAGLTCWLAVAYPRPPASQCAHKVTRVDANGYPVSINWHFVLWTGIGIGMANVNYVVVLPIAVENFSGSMWEAGAWVGLYALGALASMPIFIALGHRWTRTALFIHGFTTLVGNIMMIYGAMVQSMFWLMTGRIATGLAFGIYYTCNTGCLYLIPTWDRLEAIFISRCVYSIGFAIGPCISPLCNMVLTRQPWVMAMFPDYNAAAEGTPLFLMAIYGFCYALGSLFIFKECEILDAETEGIGIGATQDNPSMSSASWEERKVAMTVFSSVVFTNFTRNFIRVLWETGTVLILAKVYCVATGAGIVVSIVAITLVVSRNAMAKLGLACEGDNAKLMRVLEWGGAISMPFMFLYGFQPDVVTLGMFLLGGVVFYNANASQSGVLLALGGEFAIPGHFWLDKVALNAYMYISMLVAYIFGPICTFISQAYDPGQNTVALMVSLVTVLQIVITYSSVRPRSEIFASCHQETSLFKDVYHKYWSRGHKAMDRRFWGSSASPAQLKPSLSIAKAESPSKEGSQKYSKSNGKAMSQRFWASSSPSISREKASPRERRTSKAAS